MRRSRLPMLVYNGLSGIGIALAGVAGSTLLLLLAVSFFVERQHNPYFGIFLYLVLPGLTILGLLLIPLGMYRTWRRGEDMPVRTWPVVDLNRPAHRNATLIFCVGTAVFLALSAVGSYEAYHYSESVAFCGTACHEVMEPEYTTYQSSPHARVSCAECHIGSGADWFVKSKISGAYQVYATVADKYPRPVPTPIESLRPAQETCEECHWPEKFFGLQWREYDHYMYDEANTHWPVTLLMKIGGGDPRSGSASGIHWHMNIGVEVEYIATDERRQEIPWVRVTDRHTGRATVYQDPDSPLSEEEIAAAEPRLMDCIDCHNRPSHIFRSPDEAVDQALLDGRIDAGLPAIKDLAVELMEAEYSSTEEARTAIASSLTDHYRSEHPDLFHQRRGTVDAAILAVQDAFAGNIFPAMNARWSAYPDNIGHFSDRGCMRCHEGNLVSPDGVAVTTDCDACHLIVAQGSGERRQVRAGEEGLEFLHPEDMGEIWREMGCYECHVGTRP